MSDAIVRARETPVLRGRRVLYFSRWLPAVALYGSLVASAIALVCSVPVVAVISLAAGFVMYSAGIRRTHAAVRVNNDGVARLGAGDVEAAEQRFVESLAAGCTRELASIAFQNLASIALRRGAFADAADLSRASLAIASPAQPGRSNQHIARVRSTLALALACADSLDEAETVLHAIDLERAAALEQVHLVPVRALIALRRGDDERVVALLDAHRTVFRNALGGESAALVEALEGVALQRLGGVYRGAPRRRARLPYDARARGYVALLVPGGDAILAAPDALPRTP